MDIREVTPDPAPRKFTIELNEEEIKVLAAALAVANFNDVERNMESRNLHIQGRSDNIVYGLFTQVGDFVAKTFKGAW